MRRVKQRVSYSINPVTGCWEFSGTQMQNGYGQAWDGQSVTSAHRTYYALSGKLIPSGYVVDHLCRNPICINPAHMEAVTPGENIRRGLNGKLTAEQIREIRRLYAETSISYRALARQFGVSGCHISNIINGVKNKDVGGVAKPTTKPPSPDKYDWQLAAELWKQGLRGQDIAAKVGSTYGALVSYAYEHRSEFPKRRAWWRAGR
jgi:hypothetical protein